MSWPLGCVTEAVRQAAKSRPPRCARLASPLQASAANGTGVTGVAGVQCSQDPGTEGRVRLVNARGPSVNTTFAQGVVQVGMLGWGTLPGVAWAARGNSRSWPRS